MSGHGPYCPPAPVGSRAEEDFARGDGVPKAHDLFPFGNFRHHGLQLACQTGEERGVAGEVGDLQLREPQRGLGRGLLDGECEELAAFSRRPSSK
jgi:hypothetical protein